MASKKITPRETIVPVVTKKIVIAKKLGTRATAEFERELRDLFEKGYRVASKDKDSYGGVRLTLEKVEEWTWEEFVEDLQEAMRTAEPALVGSTIFKGVL